MTTLVIIAVLLAAIYSYAAFAYYRAFRNWRPMCGCDAGTCSLPQTSRETRRPG